MLSVHVVEITYKQYAPDSMKKKYKEKRREKIYQHVNHNCLEL